MSFVNDMQQGSLDDREVKLGAKGSRGERDLGAVEMFTLFHQVGGVETQPPALQVGEVPVLDHLECSAMLQITLAADQNASEMLVLGCWAVQDFLRGSSAGAVAHVRRGIHHCHKRVAHFRGARRHVNDHQHRALLRVVVAASGNLHNLRETNAGIG